MAKLILHIGASRTGSTSIQATLARSQAMLLRQGVLYPRTGFHHRTHHLLAAAIKAQRQTGIDSIPPLEDLMVKLAHEVQASGCETVVVSSDLFFNLYWHGQAGNTVAQANLRRFLELFSEVKVFCFLRHQLLLQESAYRFHVAWEGTAETAEFSERVHRWFSRAGSQNYQEIERFYRSVRPDLEFEFVGFREAKQSGLLVKSFYDRAGLSSHYTGEVKKNESLSRDGTLAMLMWNRGLVPAAMSRVEFLAWSRQAFPGHRESLFDAADFDALAPRFVPGNEELAASTGIDLSVEIEEFRQKSQFCGSSLSPEFQEQVLAYFGLGVKLGPHGNWNWKGWRHRLRKCFPFQR